MVAEGLSASLIRQAHLVLGAMMKLAVRRGLISSDPSAGTALPKQPPSEQRFLTPSELAALADAMPARLQAATWTLGLAGLRFGELAALERDDVDVLRRRIDVSKSVVDVGGHLVVGETKNRKTRSVAIPQRLAVIINDHLTSHNKVVSFPNSQGGYLRAPNFRSHVLRACTASGLEPIRTHDLRHTAASLMLAVEPDLHLVMRQLGHSSIAVTVDRYGHLLPGRVDQVADKLDAMLNDELSGGEVVAFK
jgi:integrase